MKKYLCLLMVVLLLVIPLAGCSNVGTTPKTDNTTPPKTDGTTPPTTPPTSPP